MAINVEVAKSGTDNNLGLIRKFTKRVQGSGILSRLRGRRYSARKPSPYVKKKKTDRANNSLDDANGHGDASTMIDDAAWVITLKPLLFMLQSGTKL